MIIPGIPGLKAFWGRLQRNKGEDPDSPAPNSLGSGKTGNPTLTSWRDCWQQRKVRREIAMSDDVLCDPDDISQGGDEGCAACLGELLVVFPLYTILGILLAILYSPFMMDSTPPYQFFHLIVELSLIGLYFTKHICLWLWKQIAKLIDGT